MKQELLIYPCSKNGKILKGFCPTLCVSPDDVTRTLLGWLRFSSKFGIHYYFNGTEVVSLV